MALIELPVIFKAGNRQVEVNAILDTGADSFAFVDQSVATTLGLKPSGDLQPYSGVGGKVEYGFKTPFETIQLKESPECTLKGANVLVGKLGFKTIKALIGNNFIRKARMKIDYTRSEDEVDLSCRGGQIAPVALTEPIPPWIYLAGGAVALMALFYVLSD